MRSKGRSGPCSNTAHPHHTPQASCPPQGGFSPPSKWNNHTTTARNEARAGTTPIGIGGYKAQGPSCLVDRHTAAVFEQQPTAEEAAALVVLYARKHKRRARLLTLILQHTRTKANHHSESTTRFEGGGVSV